MHDKSPFTVLIKNDTNEILLELFQLLLSLSLVLCIPFVELDEPCLM